MLALHVDTNFGSKSTVAISSSYSAEGNRFFQMPPSDRPHCKSAMYPPGRGQKVHQGVCLFSHVCGRTYMPVGTVSSRKSLMQKKA
jgi:hypothetical protein